jgi:outer membrane receptor protein involved in Fe transport
MIISRRVTSSSTCRSVAGRQHTARARLSRLWDIRQGLTTDVTARYTGAAPLVSSGSLDGFAAAAHYGLSRGPCCRSTCRFRQALSRTWELSAGVNNALNQRPALWTPAFDRQACCGVALAVSAAGLRVGSGFGARRLAVLRPRDRQTAHAENYQRTAEYAEDCSLG